MRALLTSSVLATALLGSPMIAAAQTGAYCLKSESGVTTCVYQSMAQCEQAKRSGDECLSRSETTGAGSGSGMGSSPSDNSPPAGGRMLPPSPSR